jgi:hypothetical protein
MASKPCPGESDDIGPDGGVVKQAVADAGAEDGLRGRRLLDVGDGAGAESKLGESGVDCAVKLAASAEQADEVKHFIGHSFRFSA